MKESIHSFSFKIKTCIIGSLKIKFYFDISKKVNMQYASYFNSHAVAMLTHNILLRKKLSLLKQTGCTIN